MTLVSGAHPRAPSEDDVPRGLQPYRTLVDASLSGLREASLAVAAETRHLSAWFAQRGVASDAAVGQSDADNAADTQAIDSEYRGRIVERLSDRDLLLTAIDVYLLFAVLSAHSDLARPDPSSVVRAAQRRLGCDAEATAKLFRERLHGHVTLAPPQEAQVAVVQRRARMLAAWAEALDVIAADVAGAAGSGDDEESCHGLGRPRPLVAPRGGAGGAGASAEHAVLLGVQPVEYVQILFRRVMHARGKRGENALAEEEARIKAALKEVREKGQKLQSALKRQREASALEDLSLPFRPSVLNKRYKRSVRERVYQKEIELFQTAAKLKKDAQIQTAQQEKAEEKRRVKVSKLLNKGVTNFWDHAAGIRKQACKEWVAAKKAEVLEAKKDKLLAEAATMVDELREHMQGESRDVAEFIAGDDSATREAADVPVPPLLDGQGRTLRPYQQAGLNWLVAMYERGMNGILADEMGLGKTIQTISLLAHVACSEKVWGPHLVVVPTSVLLNWEIEFKRWAPGMKVMPYYGTAKQRQAMRKGWSKTGAVDVVIAGYQTVMADHAAFKRIFWQYLILDEAHVIKNWRSQKWRLLNELHTTRRLLLSGTPLQNNIMEVWSLLRFLMNENPLFASDSNFNAWFNSPMNAMLESGVRNARVVEQLHALLRPFVLRRLKRQVEAQMPKKYEKVVRCHMSRRQRALYDEYMRSRDTQQTIEGGSYMGVIGVLMALRKVCNHPSLFEPRPVVTPFCPDFSSHAAHDEWGRKMLSVPLGPSHAVPTLLGSINPYATYDLLHTANLVFTVDSHVAPLFYSAPASFSDLAVPPSTVREAFSAADSCPRSLSAYAAAAAEHDTRRQSQGKESPALQAYLSALHASFHQQKAERAKAAEEAQRRASLAGGALHDLSSVAGLASGWVGGRSGRRVRPKLRCDNPNDVVNQADRSIRAARTRSTCFIATRVTVVQGGETGTGRDRYEEGFARTLHLRPLTHRRKPVWATAPCWVRDADGPAEFEDYAWGGPVDSQTAASVTAASLATDEVAIRTQKPGSVQRICGGRLTLWGEGEWLHPVWDEIHQELERETRHGSFCWFLGDQVSRMDANRLAAKKFGAVYVPKVAASPARYNGYDVAPSSPVASPSCRAYTCLQKVPLSCRTRVPAHTTFVGAVRRECRAVTALQSPVQLPDAKLLEYDCGKLRALAHMLPRLKAGKHRVLIFTQMARVLDILETFLSMSGHTYLRLDGSTKVEERQYLMELFNTDTRYFCFILSTRSGGVGINLTGADTVVFYDSDWNPAMDLQAQDRCHRIGQTRDVFVYRLISRHSVEENILVKARQKKTLVNLVIRGGDYGDSVGAAVPEKSTTAKQNVLQFFHHLDDDEVEMLERAAAEEGTLEDTDDGEAAQLSQANILEGNPLVGYEEGVDREAYQRALEEMKAEERELAGLEAEEVGNSDVMVNSSDLTPLQLYALNVGDVVNWLQAEEVVTRETRSLAAFREAEFDGISQ
eukprot:Rhum_TRINITY_DN531_c0_g1::Rhum_TRINITY_DN531_c0_g1_i1::g.1542::m.1542